MHPNNAVGRANSVDADQTAPSILIRVYTVCPDLSVLKHKIIRILFDQLLLQEKMENR